MSGAALLDSEAPTTSTPAPERERTWATGPEVYELVELAHRRDNGTRFYPYVGNHCCDLYDVLRKRAAAGARPNKDGFITATHGQVAADLWDDVDPRDVATARAKANSIRRWLTRLTSAGLITWAPATIGEGKYIGIRYALLAVPEVPSGGARVAQLARATAL